MFRKKHAAGKKDAGRKYWTDEERVFAPFTKNSDLRHENLLV